MVLVRFKCLTSGLYYAKCINLFRITKGGYDVLIKLNKGRSKIPSSMITYTIHMFLHITWYRDVSDTDSAGYPANNFAGYPGKY